MSLFSASVENILIKTRQCESMAGDLQTHRAYKTMRGNISVSEGRTR